MTDKQTTETPDEREQLLSQLDAKGRSLVERVLEQHPELTTAAAIEHIQEMGGL
jgi:hypothetical protein